MVEIIKFSEASKDDTIQNLRDRLQAHVALPSREDEITSALARLQVENDDLRATLKQAKIDAENAIVEAKKVGAEQAEEKFERTDTEALALLKNGIKDAQETVEKKLQKVDVLSLAMAQATLDEVFHPADGYRVIIAQMIAAQMKGLRRKSVLAINVSPKDFLHQEHLENLVDQFVNNAIDVLVDPELSAGDCIFDLRIGQLEFSISGHWNALVSAFKEMASEARKA